MIKQSKLRQIFDLQKILMSMSILIFTLFLTSCNSRSGNDIHSSKGTSDSISLAETQNTSLDSIVHFLLDASAKDFHDNQPPTPVSFRNIKVRNLIGPNEENHFMICGEFLTKDNHNKEVWTHFATIKTDPYEQWIGSNALMYCQDSKEISYTKIDLSIVLKNRFDSLQELTK